MMSPRLSLLRAGHSLAIRSRPVVASQKVVVPLCVRQSLGPRRTFAALKEDNTVTPPPADNQLPKGPNQDVLGNVNEEAVDVGDTTGETKPDLEQGTPVQEILERDPEAAEKAPQVIQDQINTPKTPSSPPFIKSSSSSPPSATASASAAASSSTPPPSSAINAASAHHHGGNDDDGGGGAATSFANMMAIRQMEAMVGGSSNGIGGSGPGMGRIVGDGGGGGGEAQATELVDGAKFGMPALPIPARNNLHFRYDPVVEQVTKLMMKDGRLSAAQRHMSFILNHLRTSPAPRLSAARPLLAGAPAAAGLPRDPQLYLRLAIDSVAPLMRMRVAKGAAGGGASLQIPVPLGLRQRRRQAFVWILDAAARRQGGGAGGSGSGSGRGMFARRVAEEVVAVAEGRSGVWERRQTVHRQGVVARVNVGFKRPRKFKR